MSPNYSFFTPQGEKNENWYHVSLAFDLCSELLICSSNFLLDIISWSFVCSSVFVFNH